MAHKLRVRTDRKGLTVSTDRKELTVSTLAYVPVQPGVLICGLTE